MSTPVFHRHANDYFSSDEWGDLSPANQRVARALGPDPLSDARHLLQPIPDRPPDPMVGTAEPGAAPTSADYAVRLTPAGARTVADLLPYFGADTRAALDFPRVMGHLPARTGDGERILTLDAAPGNARLLGVTLAWSLPDLLSIASEEEATADLRRFIAEAGTIGIATGMAVSVRQDPREAAHRAVTLHALLRKAGAQTEMRLVPTAGSFASRDVWRAAYGLGLTWGTMDLFHWRGEDGTSLFRILSSGTPAYFLPERAMEGERVPGLILEYDLPHAREPVAVFDRMAVALSHLRTVLGGRPTTKRGAELDADGLDDERDALQEAIYAMTAAGIAPGSEAARRFF